MPPPPPPVDPPKTPKSSSTRSAAEKEGTPLTVTICTPGSTDSQEAFETLPSPLSSRTTKTSSSSSRRRSYSSDCESINKAAPPPLDSLTTAQDWYDQGEHVWYDASVGEIVDNENETSVSVFRRSVLPPQGNDNLSMQRHQQRWITFLPGDPEGSYGLHQVEEGLAMGMGGRRCRCDTERTEMSEESLSYSYGYGCSYSQDDDENHAPHVNEACGNSGDAKENGASFERMARLYLDYTGQGESQSTPTTSGEGISTSTSTIKQRADLVEAHWRSFGITRTVAVSVGEASSLVVLELLQRQRNRLATGSPFPKILHVLSLNGRYSVSTQHVPTITKLIKSDRMGPSLAARAQRSDFALMQCLQPYLKGCHHKHVRREVAGVIKRQGTSQLVEMARATDEHFQENHKYRWNLPRLYRKFALNQGITFHLLASNRHAQRQVQLVNQQLEEYADVDQEFPGICHEHLKVKGHAQSSSTALLLGSSLEQLEPLLAAIRRLAFTEIPLSDNSSASQSQHQDSGIASQPSYDASAELEQGLSNASASSEKVSVDSRLDTEIIFDPDQTELHELDLFL